MSIQIKGTITLDNGSTSEFSVTPDGYNQWGADTGRLGATVDFLTTLHEILAEQKDEIRSEAGIATDYTVENLCVKCGNEVGTQAAYRTTEGDPYGRPDVEVMVHEECWHD